MQHLTKKRVIALIVLVMIVIIVTTLVKCNKSTPTVSQKGKFNEQNAKQESRVALEKFLKVSENGTLIANQNEMDKIREFVNNKCKGYFTDDFINDTTNTLSNKSFGITSQVFYLSNVLEKVKFYNHYKIYSPTVDKENKTITYKLETNDIGIAPTMNVNVEMKNQNGKWKINKATD